MVGLQILLGIVTFLLFLVLVANWFTQTTDGGEYRFPSWGVLPFLSLLLFIASFSLVFIGPNRAGVVVSPRYLGGMRPTPLFPGLHVLCPFVDRVYTYSLAAHTVSMGDENVIDARTRDGQRIYIDASVIYTLDPNQVTEIHRNWQGRYEAELIVPITRGTVRDIVAQYQAEEANTKREEVARGIEGKLSAQLQEHGIWVIKFVLRDVTFTPEFTEAIEQRQIAEQQAERAKFVVEQKKYEAEQMRQIAQGEADAAVIRASAEAEALIIKAKAEAEAIRFIGDALKWYPQVVSYRLAEKSDGIKYVFTSGDIPFVFPAPE